MATILTTDWDPASGPVHREHLVSGNGEPALALLRHPTYPFRATIGEGLPLADLREVADAYLARIASLDAALASTLHLLCGGRPEGFGWLPLTWLAATQTDPRGSFAVERVDDGKVLDSTIVLVAANRRLQGEQIHSVDGLGVGLRVTIHLDPHDAGTDVSVRITGASMSGLDRALAPPDHLAATSLLLDFEFLRVAVAGLFDPRSVGFSGVEQTGNLLRVAGVGARPQGPDGVARGFEWTATIVFDDSTARLGSMREQEQLSFAANPRAFRRDPASCGSATDLAERAPTRDRAVLDPFRQHLSNLPATDLETPGLFKVLQSQLADPLNQPGDVQSLHHSPRLPLRSDQMAAAHAWLRGDEFFARLAQFSLPAVAFFKFARLPLLMRHRASFDAHPDGTAVMGQVRLVGAPLPLLGPYTASARPELEVAFGAAELRHRDIRHDGHGRQSAQPLGLAADPRWAWHEFGHVVSYAATGALEYQFAHSFGDALAAVLNDPASCIVDDGLCQGLTYPWVPAGRRHDREAIVGWCWCGRRNGQRHAPVLFPPPLYKGYVEEQMLSSSVFRLYSAIGGQNQNDIALRERAAAQAAYLLLRGAQLLGSAALVPARSADALVSAMIDADIGTQQPGTLFLGGCVHKVIRWAFERQGLYATTSPHGYVEGPGQPPAVDLWIMDRRISGTSDGGYEPVKLEWPAAAPEPSWFAHATDGVRIDGNGDVHVFVRNRGSDTATDVVVRAWVAPVANPPLHWQSLGQTTASDVPGGGASDVTLDQGPGGTGLHYLLVEVSSKEDPSNLDAATHLPCATGAPPDAPEALRDLVANDNNLALRLITT